MLHRFLAQNTMPLLEDATDNLERTIIVDNSRVVYWYGWIVESGATEQLDAIVVMPCPGIEECIACFGMLYGR